MKKYSGRSVEYMLAHPDEVEENNSIYEMMGMGECIPVGIYNDFQGEKGDPEILEKTQYNLRDRFGHLSEEDEETENIKNGSLGGKLA